MGLGAVFVGRPTAGCHSSPGVGALEPGDAGPAKPLTPARLRRLGASGATGGSGHVLPYFPFFIGRVVHLLSVTVSSTDFKLLRIELRNGFTNRRLGIRK